MLLQELEQKELIKPPKWLSDNCQYLTMMGSVAYGVSSDTSDMDIYGFSIPPKSIVFPHLAGNIEGFDEYERFEQWQEHHIIDPSACAGHGREYDFSIYNIVKYFKLLMDNNPNMVDSLFTPQFCVLHCTKVGNMVRDRRDIFLHKGAYHKFRGYAFSQLSKADAVKKNIFIIAIRKFEEDHNVPTDTTYAQSKIRENFPQLSTVEYMEYSELFSKGQGITKRFESQKRWNTDVKFLYHLARLLDECEQILTLHTMDLQRSKDYMKAIRKGEVSEEDLKQFFSVREKELEKVYHESSLRYSPDKAQIKTLLVECLEEHYGNMSKCIVIPDAAKMALKEIETILDRYRPSIQ